ncbi:MAG: class I SAM-dependent methyltransferase [Candidatus Nitrosocosmicus sp.]
MSKNFPNWNELYKFQTAESMPWYYGNLDTDLEQALNQLKISNGKFLDIGTGPATQVIQLAKIGLTVVGSDISENAIKRANKIYWDRKDASIRFIVDDILNSNIKDNEFDYIFDRGCFHVLSIDKRQKYIKTIKRILKENGIFFLKCFSEKEQGDDGPYRFSEDKIKEIFGKDFTIDSIKDTVYQGTLNPLPKALFVIMKN